MDRLEIEDLIKEKFGTLTNFAEILGKSQPNLSQSLDRMSPKFVNTLKKHGIYITQKVELSQSNGDVDMLVNNAMQDVKIIKGENAKEYLSLIRRLLKSQEERITELKNLVDKQDKLIEKLIDK